MTKSDAPDAPHGDVSDAAVEADRREPSPAAQRALEEAAARRAKAAAEAKKRAREEGGPKGPEPTRYGDWERGGRAVDF